MSVSDDIRRQLAKLCRNSRTRNAKFSPTLPTHWAPQHVIDPRTNVAFTPTGAWLYVADLLEGGCDVDVITLDKPAGKKGYVIISKGDGVEDLYIKLQLGSGVVIGRSFHVSIPKGRQA